MIHLIFQRVKLLPFNTTYKKTVFLGFPIKTVNILMELSVRSEKRFFFYDTVQWTEKSVEKE